LTAGLIAACAGNIVSAAETLNPIVVTPARTAQTINEANASVTVLSQEDIQQSTATTVEDLLRSVPGVVVARTGGGPGKQSSVFIRGANSDHVVVLVDGVKVGNATTGATQFENIPLALVDRIEVVRGPRSSLYGSEAIGGVIQIFTRRGSTDPDIVSEVAAGNNGTSRLTQHFSGSAEDTRYNLSASLFDTDGINSQPGTQSDDDGFTSKSAAVSVDHLLTQNVTVGLNLLHAEGDNDYDSAFAQSPNDRYTNDFVQQSGRVYADFLASDRLTVHTQFGFGRELNENFINLAPNFSFETTREQFLVQGDYLLTDNQMVTLGIERINDEIEAGSTYAEDERYNNAVFGQWQTVDQPFDLQASLRHDDNEAFGRETTGSVSAGYQIVPQLKPYISYGTGFKAPDFNELYSPFGANPDLDPETSETYEAGLKGGFGRLSWQLAIYQTEFENLIQYEPVGEFTFIPFNTSEATAKGGDVSLRYAASNWNVEAGAGYVRAVDDETGRQLARRPKWNARLAASRSLGRVDLDLELIGRTDAFDTQAGVNRIPGHVLTNVGIDFEAQQNLNLGLEVSNLFAQDAPTAEGYNGAPRQVLASLRYSY
jgi:vitamin B12 transporter